MSTEHQNSTMTELECQKASSLYSAPGGTCSIDHEFVELVILVPQHQFEELQRQAGRDGFSIGQLMRRLIDATVKGPRLV